MSIADLITLSRRKLTDEEYAELRRRSRLLCEKQEREWLARHKCSECGADTWNYSHSFSCSLRGSGF